MQEAKNIL